MHESVRKKFSSLTLLIKYDENIWVHLNTCSHLNMDVLNCAVMFFLRLRNLVFAPHCFESFEIGPPKIWNWT